ncbi:MAG: YqaE/Pmp3 family membrane protein [Bacteroidetes bacterium]|nr:YqaE/Pmp3 family membrane protein [Bacteroidota bacterium]MBU1718053.1 YqaE/Pmp3 family membrane protein [Bacteroidota bacterium]
MSTNRAVTISATADDKTNIVLSDFVRTETKRSLLTEADVAPVLIHSGQITKLFRKNATSSYLKPKTGAGNKSPVITEEGLLLLILAIFIPPLAVYLAVDICDAFWINIILTLLFLLPGIIHAIYVILNEY